MVFISSDPHFAHTLARSGFLSTISGLLWSLEDNSLSMELDGNLGFQRLLNGNLMASKNPIRQVQLDQIYRFITKMLISDFSSRSNQLLLRNGKDLKKAFHFLRFLQEDLMFDLQRFCRDNITIFISRTVQSCVDKIRLNTGTEG